MFSQLIYNLLQELIPFKGIAYSEWISYIRTLRYKSEYESCIAKIAKIRKGHCTTFRPLSSFVCVTAFYTLFVF